jgi:hypothetical protein
VVFVVATVLSVVGELPPVDTLGDGEEHAAPSNARATTHAASPARRRGIRRSGERDGFKVVEVRFVMTISTGGSPIRFTKIEIAAARAKAPKGT